MQQQFSIDRRPVADIRRENISNILLYLRQFPTVSRQDLCAHSGLTGAGLSRNIRELLQAGLVIEESEEPAKGQLGRRRSLVRLNPDGAYVVGITIAANRKSVVIMNAVGSIVAAKEIYNLQLSNPRATLANIAQITHWLIDEFDINRQLILGAGIVFGVPDSGISLTAKEVTSAVLGWHKTPIKELLQPQLGMPIRTVSRARALLQVETENLFMVKPSQKYLLINSGFGLGTAYHDFGNANSHAGRSSQTPSIQISHIAITGDRSLCSCGRRGCLEQTGGGAGVIRKLYDIAPDKMVDFSRASENMATVFSALAAGDKIVQKAFYDVGRHFARGIDIATAMLMPDQVFIAGEVGRQKNYIEGIRDGLAEINPSFAPSRLRICETRSADASGIFALNAFLFSDDLNLGVLQSLQRDAS